MLELGDHRGGCVAGGALPEAALNGAEEVQDPRADGDGEGEDGGGGRVFGERRGRGAEGDGQQRVQDVTGKQRGKFGRPERAAIELPKQQRDEGGRHREQPAGEEDQRLRRYAPERAHALLQLQLHRAALAVAGQHADGDERQQEDGGQFAGAESGSPDADERGERLATLAGADLRVRADRADERDADERAHRDEEDPPGLRDEKLAPLFFEEPDEGPFT